VPYVGVPFFTFYTIFLLYLFLCLDTQVPTIELQLPTVVAVQACILGAVGYTM